MLSYSTTNILKLSAAVYLNFENKIFVDLNLFLKNYMNPYMGIGLWCWGVKVVLKLYTRYPIVARALGRVRRASKGILHTSPQVVRQVMQHCDNLLIKISNRNKTI